MDTPFTKKGKKEKQKSQALSLYLVRKALLEKHKGRCVRCGKSEGVRLTRIRKGIKEPKENDYTLLCHICITLRCKEAKQEKTRLWRRKAARRKITRGGFWNKIRKKILERDHCSCVWCGSKEKLGLGPLIPLSRGGNLISDNYVTTCQKCRPSKGDKLPLNFIFESIDLDEFLHEQLDEHLRVKGDPGKYIQIRFFLFSEISEFLHHLTSNKNLPSRIRTRAELINIKLLS